MIAAAEEVSMLHVSLLRLLGACSTAVSKLKCLLRRKITISAILDAHTCEQLDIKLIQCAEETLLGHSSF